MTMLVSFNERAALSQSSLGKRLFQLCDTKKTNLALSADVTSAEKLLALADQLGPEICVLKSHIDIIEDFTPALSKALRKLANQHQFLLFEDRKFADIGNTVKHQYAGGIYRIADWADIINAHALPGEGVVQGLMNALHDEADKVNRGLLLIAEMSSQGHLLNEEYQRKTLRLAQQFPDFVIGFITQHALSAEAHDQQFINMTPGVQLTAGNDSLSQQYVTPEKAILENGTDIIIVGRGIIAADDPLTAAIAYRRRAWDSYLKRCELRRAQR